MTSAGCFFYPVLFSVIKFKVGSKQEHIFIQRNERVVLKVIWFHERMQVSAMDDCRCRLNFHSGAMFTQVFNICAACGVIIFSKCLSSSITGAWSCNADRASPGTCEVGTLEAKLPATLRGGPLSRPTFTTGELPSDQSPANRKLMNS